MAKVIQLYIMLLKVNFCKLPDVMIKVNSFDGFDININYTLQIRKLIRNGLND